MEFGKQKMLVVSVCRLLLFIFIGNKPKTKNSWFPVIPLVKVADQTKKQPPWGGKENGRTGGSSDAGGAAAIDGAAAYSAGQHQHRCL